METDMLHSAAHALPTYFHAFTDSGSLALHSAKTALFIILDPVRLLYLFGGVMHGPGLGILPGIGGVAGTALLLPFTYKMDPPTAMALLLGLAPPPPPPIRFRPSCWARPVTRPRRRPRSTAIR